VIAGADVVLIEQKGMTFDNDLVILFPFSLASQKKREEEKENELATIVIKSHALSNWGI
jgi:hypothetical protein